jgi:hypothetical protein
VSVSRLRALGEVRAEDATATVNFDGVAFVVGLALRTFPNGGSWSFFVCPCGRRARILRLVDGSFACSGCLKARGFHSRSQLIPTAHRAAYTAPRVLARLNSPSPARINPRPGRMLDRRALLERGLKRSLLVARRARIAEFERDAGKS